MKVKAVATIKGGLFRRERQIRDERDVPDLKILKIRVFDGKSDQVVIVVVTVKLTDDLTHDYHFHFRGVYIQNLKDLEIIVE